MVYVEKNAANLVNNTAKLQLNYLSMLACIDKAQEDKLNQNTDESNRIETALSAQVDYSPINKVAAHWGKNS